MPNYKVVDSDKLDADLARIADVIRKNSGTTVKLDFPEMYIRILENLWTHTPYSKGLSYTPSLDGTEYSVSGIGTCTDTDIVIPPIYEGKPVTGISDWAFTNKTNITSVTIPSSLKSMGKAPFYCCTSLERVTIRDGATCIGTHAFYGCTSLSSIMIPNSVTSIGENAFERCSALMSITFPRYLTSIDAYTCYQCSSLTDVIIPDSVKSIGALAFAHCSSLTSITIPESVTSIYDDAFGGRSGLTSITVDAQNTVYHSAGNCLIETKSKVLIVGCQNSIIPDDGSVTSIGNYAFYDCLRLTSITIPDTITSICWGTFYGCSGLTSITIPNSVTSISGYAFSNCDNLTDIIIPDSVTSIGNYAFYESSKLTSVTIGNGVTSIGELAFAGCSGLKSVTIGNSVTSIGSQAFSGCSGLTSVHINNMAAWCSISFINGMANPLYYAHNLYMNGKLVTDLVIPDGVMRIGSRTFWDCDSIKSVTIPDSVKSMGDYVFVFGDSLTSVTMLANNPPTITSNTFYGISALEKIFVPAGCGAAYKSATNWSNYASIIEEVIA